MSSDENMLLDSACRSTERVIARRFLLGSLTFSLALILLVLETLVSVDGPLGLCLIIFTAALFIAGAVLERSRPQGSKGALTPRKLRRIARVADVPELGALIMVYGSLIAAMTFSAVVFVVILTSPPT
jgi:hypothetical protein